jgi:GT2 family glycosyltransferase
MFSVIVCSIDPPRFAAVEAMYRSAFGAEPWELIGIHDAKSLAEGYNRAVERAKGEWLIFSHDDIEILSPAFPQRLKSHLSRFDLIGLVGTSRVVNSRWLSAGTPYIFGQVCHFQKDGQVTVDVYGAPRPVVGNIQGLDGVFMASNKNVLAKVKFDAETFDHFHLYDLDFSLTAYHAGFRLAVANDINILHHSPGQFDKTWEEYARRFEQKWRPSLPNQPRVLHQWAGVLTRSREHAMEIMNPPHWRMEE